MFQFQSRNADGVISVFDFAANAWSLAAKATFPLTEKAAIYGKLGLSANTANVDCSLDLSIYRQLGHFFGTSGPVGPVPTSYLSPGSYSETSNAPLIGVGVEYLVSKDIKLRLEYENYGRFGGQTTTGRANTAMTSLGISRLF
jgi:opacity protein-like surface antigen